MVTNGLLASRQALNKPQFLKTNHGNDTIAAFAAMAMVNSENGIVVGGNYQFGGSGSAVAITLSNIVDVLFDAAKRGLAYWIDNITVTKEKPTGLMQKNVIAGYSGAKSTSIVDVKFTAMYEEAANTDFENYLRSNPTDDVFLFTNNTFLHIPFNTNKINYANVGMQMNDQNTTIATLAGFEFMYRGESGEISLQAGFGYNAANYKACPSFTIIEGSLNNATATGTIGKYKRIKRTTTATVSEIPLSITGFGADFYVLNGDTDQFIGGTNFTYDTVNAKLVIAAATPAGVYKVKVVAINNVGIKGEAWYEITII